MILRFAGLSDQLPGLNPYRTPDQLGPVVGVEERIIEPGIFLGDQEGFLELALLVQIADVELGVAAIISSAAENDPPAVRPPGVITVGILGIHKCLGLFPARAQVHEA